MTDLKTHGKSRRRRRALEFTILLLGWLLLGWSSEAWALCPPPTAIAPGTTTLGALESGDCTVAQLGLDPDDHSHVDLYQLTLAVDGFLTVDYQSVEFDAYLVITDIGLNQILYVDDDAGFDTNSLITRVPLAAGSYIIAANSFEDGETGDYSLSTTLHATANPACSVVVDVAATVVANGDLDTGDCTVAQLGLDGGDHTFVQQYRVSLPSGGPLTIALDSLDFDAYLLVLDDAMTTVLAEDDNSGIGTPGIDNALLTDLALSPGSYRILANQFFPGENGDFTLTLTPEPSAGLLQLSAFAALAALVRRRRASHYSSRSGVWSDLAACPGAPSD